MHPDCGLVLQKCALSPRLGPRVAGIGVGILRGGHYVCGVSKKMAAAAAETQRRPPRDNVDEIEDDGGDGDGDGDEVDLVRIDVDIEDDVEPEDAERGIVAEGQRVRMANKKLCVDYSVRLTAGLRSEADGEDAISLCSDLSVGQEGGVDEEPLPPPPPASAPYNGARKDGVPETKDARSSTSTEEDEPTRLPSGAIVNPFAIANALRFPVAFGPQTGGSVTSAPSPFPEEFLRKSHLYAEELMRHQMQLMAAARASAFTLCNASIESVSQTHQLRGQTTTAHFAGIHTPLDPISKMSQLSAAAAAAAAATAAMAAAHMTQSPPSDTLAKLTALSVRTQPQPQPQPPLPSAPPTTSSLNQLHPQMAQAQLPTLVHDVNNPNGNLNERALKFSIDNILKADFGRSQPLESATGPVAAKRVGPTKCPRASRKQGCSVNDCLPAGGATFGPGSGTGSGSGSGSGSSLTSGSDPVDLTSLLASASSSTTQSFSHSLISICTNSNDSSSTAVSSSYGSAGGDLLKSSSSPTQTPALSPPAPAPAPPPPADSAKAPNRAAAADVASDAAATSGRAPIVWPAWVYCTRYSDRPSSGRSPRTRKPKKSSGAVVDGEKGASSSPAASAEDKRPRTAFSGSQLARLKHEFNENRYLTEKRRQQLSAELGLNEAQIKIWFQNKRAKLKKSSGTKNPLALQLMAQGLYNHSTIPLTREEEELQELQERENAAMAAAAAAAAAVAMASPNSATRSSPSASIPSVLST